MHCKHKKTQRCEFRQQEQIQSRTKPQSSVSYVVAIDVADEAGMDVSLRMGCKAPHSKQVQGLTGSYPLHGCVVSLTGTLDIHHPHAVGESGEVS